MTITFNRDSPLFRHRQLAPSASIHVSPLCLGTMNFGERETALYGECSKEEAFAIMDHFYSQGGNFFDTANSYQHGQSEEWIGEWMAKHDNRDDIVLATKYTMNFHRNRKDKIISNYVGNGAKSLKLSLDASLKNLRTMYVDILYIHWWDAATSIPELMHSLNDVVTSGKVLYLGVSDTPAWVVSMANEYARNHGLRQFSVYQGAWNASMRDFERDIIPMASNQGMALCPYGVLGSGRFQTEEGFKARAQHNPGRQIANARLTDRDREVCKVLETIGKEKDAGLFQIALAYVMHKAPYVFPLVGQRRVSHLKDSIAGLSVTLTEEDIDRIEASYDFDVGFPHTFLNGAMFGTARRKQIKGPGDVALYRSTGTFDWVEPPKPIKPYGSGR
ncbi:putative Norsolorinic acid reductase [Westerdykella ornata]|uniref:Putative Norsolorinic acid reductase n=1 Tax=Westerdykella ornata TaxID=318751 RepID=A0A6A6J4V1_WESOR|nr:putative Norsolorinic acid reductase [Westerdykella ornata]KAF2271601.1 putative Norsolorinic acid reductase [Westerdykella ornata]